MTNLLTIDETTKFAEPIGRVFIASSNLEWAISEYVSALDGIRDILYVDADFQRQPISRKIKKIKDSIKDLSKKNYVEYEIVALVKDLELLIEKRNTLSHGQFFTKKLTSNDGSIGIVKYNRGRNQPEYYTFSLNDIIDLGSKLRNAASVFSIYAHKLRRNNTASAARSVASDAP